nr:hypothetical protein BaRGS_030292 [Batillaria attramentaria]
MGTYNSSSARDRGNVTAICKDGQTYVLCLRKVDKTIECTNEKTQVADERRKAQEKLTQAGCDTGAECLAGVDKCQADMKQAQGNRQHTEVVDCKIAQTYHNCLKTQETGGNCTGAFAAELKYAMDDITAQEKAGNCKST